MDLEGLKRIVNGPLGFSLRGATYGALLGWLHDKSKEEKDKKNSYHGMSIGAVLGALGGAGYGQFRSDRSHAFDVQELKRKIDALSEKKAEDIEKAAQGYGNLAQLYKHKASMKPKDEDERQYYTASLMRGVGKGVHEALPGLADTFGDVAGLLNGLGHGAWNYFSGSGTFGDGFSRGFSDSADFAKKYYSDPIRHAQMYYGGDKVRKELTNWKNFYANRIMDDVGPAYDWRGRLTDKYRRAAKAIGAGDTIGAFASKGTEWGAQALMLGGLLKGIWASARAASGAPATASAVGAGASVSAPAVSTAGRMMNTAKNALGKTWNVVMNPWFLSSSSGIEEALRQNGRNRAKIRHDERIARENSQLKEDLMREASYWTQKIYEKGLKKEDRESALNKAKDYYDQLRRFLEEG